MELNMKVFSGPLVSLSIFVVFKHRTISHKQLIYKSSIPICILFTTIFAGAQTNLLLNPNADSDSENWSTFGQATIEEFNGNKIFVVRNGCGGNSFSQDVNLTESDIGKFALLIGRGASERINANRSITGLPYLYGYMLKVNNPRGGIINAYLQGQKMRARAFYPDDWVMMYGVFQVPENTVAISFILSQAERKNDPPNGSAARFDNLGLYLFDTEEDALKFVKAYK
ncbi:MAG: hypothetical protein ACRD6X_08920 [Pyrinomonadaceae bacterium]